MVFAILAAVIGLAAAAPMPNSEPPMHDAVSSALAQSADHTSSSVAHQAPSSVAHEASVPVAHVTSSPVHAATSTALAQSSAPTPSHGSGNTNWGGSGYDDCVQQCVASNAMTTAAYTAPPAAATPHTGSGAVHTVIVAPAQGVLRYVPFAVNASIGDTIKFVWGANGHTVTKGSALQPCNATAEAPFASGLKDKDFIFEQVVNSTDVSYFYCAAGPHCSLGMFGMINPAVASGSATSAGKAVPEMAKTDADVAAEWAYTSTQTKGNTKAANWGNNIDMAALPEWAHKAAAENIMYTRTVLAANPEIQAEDGSIDLGLSGDAPLMVPTDITLALNNAAAAPAAAAPAAPVAPEAAPEVNPAGSLSTGGASSLAPSAFVGAIVVALSFLAL